MHERRDHAAFVYKAILLTFALALVGISSWGMVESIALTSNTISEFWKIVNVVNEKVSKFAWVRPAGVTTPMPALALADISHPAWTHPPPCPAWSRWPMPKASWICWASR